MALGRRCVSQENTTVEVELAEGSRRMNAEIVRITEPEFADPGEIGLVFELAEPIHSRS